MKRLHGPRAVCCHLVAGMHARRVSDHYRSSAPSVSTRSLHPFPHQLMVETLRQSANWPAVYGESAVTAKSDIQQRRVDGRFVPEAAVASNQLTPTGSADESVRKDREFAALVSVGISDQTQPGETGRSAPSSLPISDWSPPRTRSARRRAPTNLQLSKSVSNSGPLCSRLAPS